MALLPGVVERTNFVCVKCDSIAILERVRGCKRHGPKQAGCKRQQAQSPAGHTRSKSIGCALAIGYWT